MADSSFLWSIVDQVCQVARAGQRELATCAVFRVSCEGWFKVLLLAALSECFQNLEETVISPELQNVDLVVANGQQRVLLELKTFPTNYGAVGKPITQFIDGVIRDAEKLCGRRQPIDTCLVVWLAYPIPDPVPRAWSAHENRVTNAVHAVLRTERVQLWANNFAHLYVMECR